MGIGNSKEFRADHPEGKLYTNFSVMYSEQYQQALDMFNKQHPDSPIMFSIHDDAYDNKGNRMAECKALVWNDPLIFGHAVNPNNVGMWIKLMSDLTLAIYR